MWFSSSLVSSVVFIYTRFECRINAFVESAEAKNTETQNKVHDLETQLLTTVFTLETSEDEKYTENEKR